MADVVVGHAPDVAEAERQHRSPPLKRLALRLLVDAQDEGMVGRVQVELDDVAHLVEEQRIARAA